MSLSTVPHQPGTDETWERLGEEWQRIDGVVDGARFYVTWKVHQDGRSELAGLYVEGAPITSELLRSIPVGRLSRLPAAERMNLGELAPLRRGQHEDPGAFAARVARYYRLFAEVTPHPAKAIAHQSGTPVGTVHGWIREARMRGKLPPGTRGRAG